MRIRLKMLSAFVVIGLFSAGLLGGISYMKVRGVYLQAARDHYLELLRKELAAYFVANGSMDTSSKMSGFDRFVERRLGEQMAFKYVVMTPTGTVVVSGDGYAVGEQVSQDDFDQAGRVRVGGEVVALAAVVGEVPLWPGEKEYYKEVRQTFLIGALSAVGLALLLGVFLTLWMTHGVVSLVRVARLIRDDPDSDIRIPVSSNDEVGELTEIFYDMHDELVEANEELIELTVNDPLTGLHNWAAFKEQADQFYEHAKRYEHSLSVAVGNLDGFSRLNEEYSREAGDMVLERMGRLLRKTLRRCDLIARTGGAEFVFLFPNTNEENAFIACDKMKEAVRNYPWYKCRQGMAVTISMGVCGRVDLGSMDAMLGRVDQLLRVAKAKGKNSIVSSADDPEWRPE